MTKKEVKEKINEFIGFFRVVNKTTIFLFFFAHLMAAICYNMFKASYENLVKVTELRESVSRLEKEFQEVKSHSKYAKDEIVKLVSSVREEEKGLPDSENLLVLYFGRKVAFMNFKQGIKENRYEEDLVELLKVSVIGFEKEIDECVAIMERYDFSYDYAVGKIKLILKKIERLFAVSNVFSSSFLSINQKTKGSGHFKQLIERIRVHVEKGKMADAAKEIRENKDIIAYINQRVSNVEAEIKALEKIVTDLSYLDTLLNRIALGV